MIIHIIVDDQPQDNGGKIIVGIAFLDKRKAHKYIRDEKKKDPYDCQYYTIESLTVKI